MTTARKRFLKAQLETLEERLAKGLTIPGPKADALFVKLLAEYEAVYRELRLADHV